jgi:hypothetical protein
MLPCTLEKDRQLIFHNDKVKGKGMFFVFKDKDYLPCSVIKIYEKARRFDRVLEILKTMASHENALLKESVPKILDFQETDKYHVVYEEFIDGILMQKYTGGSNLFWKKDFGINCMLLARWLTQFNKNFTLGKILIPAEKIEVARKAVASSCQLTFLNIPAQDIEVPAVAVHSDLSPANILRVRDKLVILDWDRVAVKGFPCFDLLNFITRYLHTHYKFQKHGLFLEPKVSLQYFDLFYLKKNSLSKIARGQIGLYCHDLGLAHIQRDVLIALWLYGRLAQIEDVASWIFSPGT